MKDTLNVDFIFEKNLNKVKTAQVTLSKPVFEEPISKEDKEIIREPVSEIADPKFPADTINPRFDNVVILLNKNLNNLSFLAATKTGAGEMESISKELEECRDSILSIQEDVNTIVPLKK